MACAIIKIRDEYFMWSTTVDAPITNGMTIEQLTKHIESRYGSYGLHNLPKRLERVESTGSSFYGDTLNDTISGNRAGDDGIELTADQIYDMYQDDRTE